MKTPSDFFGLAVTYFDQRRYAEAADLAGTGLSEYPEDARLLQLYGTARCNMGDYAAACDALEQATVLVPLHPLAQYALATSYFRLEQIDLACVIYEHLAKTVASTSLLSLLAVRFGEMERHSDALKVCERITDLDPRHHQAYFGIAFYLCRLGFPPHDLIPHLAMAMNLAPTILHYRLNLAFNCAEAGDIRLARRLLETIPVASVRCPYWLKRMQQVFFRVGDGEKLLACTRQMEGLDQADRNDGRRE